MANRGRGRGRYSWSGGLQHLVQVNRSWHRTAGPPSVPGGQSWDPFRPVQESQPSQGSSDMLPASGSNAAYTRRSSSKLVLQSRTSDVKASKTEDARKEAVLHHRGRAAPLAQETACPSQPSAAQGVHNCGGPQGRKTRPSAAVRQAHTVGQGVAAAAHPQPRLNKKSIANAAVRHTRKIWQRQSKAGPKPAKQGTPHTSKGLHHTESCAGFRVSAIQEHPNTWHRQPQSPRFARRRGSQLVRLSSASPARVSSSLLHSGSRRRTLDLAVSQGTGPALPVRTQVATTPRAVSTRLSSGASPSVLVRRGNTLVRMSKWNPPMPSQPHRKVLNIRKLSAQGVPLTAKLHRSQKNQLQRSTQLRRIGSVMYRVGKSYTGSHSLQRTETPRRILKPALALASESSMASRPQTPRYARRAGKLVRIPTPAATLLKPPAARVATGAKAAAAARLLKQAQMRRHPTSMYSRHSMLHASSASPRQSALCPAFCSARGLQSWCSRPRSPRMLMRCSASGIAKAPAMRRTGRCEGQRKGQCGLRHDPAWGQCSKERCIYLHKELPASSGVCRAYAAGFCSKGQSCTQKHLTPKMLRELRASRTLRAGNAKVTASKGQPSNSRQGTSETVEATLEHEDGCKKRKWRYFWADGEES